MKFLPILSLALSLFAPSAMAASVENTVPLKDLDLASNSGTLLSLNKPFTLTLKSKWTTVKIKLKEPLPCEESLVLRGTAKVDSAATPKHLGIILTNGNGQKAFAKAAFRPDKTISFDLPLTQFKGDAKADKPPLAVGETIAVLDIFASFDQEVDATFTLESFSIVKSEARHVLFKGDFEIRSEWRGVHPRLYVSAEDLKQATANYRAKPDSVAICLPARWEMTEEPIPFNQDVNASSIQRNAILLAKMAAAYRITGEQKYLDRVLLWVPMLNGYQPPVMKSIGSGVPLTAGHILLGCAIAYDVLKGHVDEKVEASLRDVLIRQGRQTYQDLSSMNGFPYEQNHFIIPICGLGVASMAIADEVPEAKTWGAFTSTIMERTLDTISHDGWFFEGHSYWNYTMQFPATYVAARSRVLGGDYFAKPPFKDTARYLAHMTLPVQNMVFDFADWGPRVEAGTSFQPGYDKPWHTLTSRTKLFIPYLVWREGGRDPFLHDFIWSSTAPDAKMTGAFAIDGLFGLLLQIPFGQEPKPMKAEYPGYPPYHYFSDMEVVHWRENWSDRNATAIAFKSGPPAGHHFAKHLERTPDAKPSLGHAHPDAGSFLLFSRGVFLTNDTGYTGKKETADHNSILVDGIGQHKGGTAWSTFTDKPYPEYNKIRMENIWLASKVVASTAVLEAAYDDALQISSLRRNLILVDARFLVVRDSIESKAEHVYSWRVHTDKPPVATATNRYRMDNDSARLVIVPLAGLQKAEIAPTIVETELYNKQGSRPQQRGFHLEAFSAKQASCEFLTAFHIEATSDNPDTFTATRPTGNRVDLKDAAGTCSAWVGADDQLSGQFAYVLRDGKGAIASVGLSGKSLKLPELTVEVPNGGKVTLHRTASGTWEGICNEDSAGSCRVTITENGKSQNLTLKSGAKAS